MVSSVTDPMDRFVSAQFAVDDHYFTLCNVYGPNTSKDGAPFFESLYTVIVPSVPCILCGDFNTVADPNRDRRGCNVFLSPWAYNWSDTLSHLMHTYDLQDVWRLHHPDATAFTWHRPNSVQASHLDMFG